MNSYARRPSGSSGDGIFYMLLSAVSKMQQEVYKEKVSPENESVHTLGSPPELVEPVQKS